MAERYKHPTGCEAQLAWPTILTRKVGHTDLLFGVQSGFISRSVHTRLQVSLCSGYDLCHSVNIQTHTHTDSILISLY